MSTTPEMLTVKRAAEELGLSPVSIRRAVMRGTLEVVPLDGRTYLVSREEVERYRREHLGQRGKRMLPDEALTEQQRKQRAYQQAYYQRRKAAREQQPAPEPAQ
jgi:excisionase family DNA binding protein